MGVRGRPVAWNKWYSTERWARIRRHQLREHPLCAFCAERGIVFSIFPGGCAHGLSRQTGGKPPNPVTGRRGPFRQLLFRYETPIYLINSSPN